MTNGRTLLLLVFGALLSGQSASASDAAVCEQLRQRLMSVPQTISNGGDVRRYSSAVTRQNFEIRKARGDLQALGCGSGSIVVFDASGKSACLELSDALERMEDNKRILEEKRDMLRNGGQTDSGERADLIAALDVNGCNEPTLDSPESGDAAATLPQTSGHVRMPELAPGEGDDWEAGRPYDGAGLGIGSLRTLCVRTCDGAFFPISANATPLNFNRDARICEQMCPGTQTELYYHGIRDQESADMVSASTGRPYRQMPTAFAYLNRPSGEKPACGCNLSAYYQEMRKRQTSAAPKPEQPYSSITHLPGSKVANPPAAAVETVGPAPVERPYDPAAGHVRQVGPTFIPPETSSIDLRNPATPGAQPIQQ